MIITQTPFRISFFGGGTDFFEFYKQHNGSVISTTFDKYAYVTVRHLPRFFEYSNEFTYSKTERVNSIDDINHPAIREAMKYLKMNEIRLIYEGDLPARSGIGTSSSFAVGMLNAFHALKGQFTDKEKLAKEAIYLERVLCNECGGEQDQIAASFGGLNRINFHSDGFEVNPIIISPERKNQLNSNLMLFFTGLTRFSADIAIVQGKSIAEKTEQLKEMLCLVDEAQKVLTQSTNLLEFGKLLDYTWKLKRGITDKISNDIIDEIYLKAIKAGAIGGKLLGAGGGGFILFYVEQEKQKRVREALKDLLYIPFKFENFGARVIYYSPEDYDPIENELV